MRNLALVCVALLGAGCRGEDPGLALHVVVPQTVVSTVGRLVITVEATTGSLGDQAGRPEESGVEIHATGGQVELHFVRGKFVLQPEFDVLLVPTGAAVVVRLSGQMLLDDGRVLGEAAAVNNLALDPDRRTAATLTFACSVASCEAPNPGEIDLDKPPSTPVITQIAGADDADKLVPLAVGDFSPNGGDLVAAAPDRGEVYVFHGRDWTAPGHQKNLDATMADVTILGQSGETLGDAAAVGDFDGDGKDDLVVTSTNAMNPSARRSGAAFLFRGTRLGSPGIIDLSSATPDMSVYGSAAQEWLGSSVALGHVTSEAAFDLVVGAPGAAGAAGQAQAGRIYVVIGGGTPPARVLAGDPGAGGEQDATIFGPAANEQIGALALATGYLDGDNRAEIVMGDYLGGSVYVVAGTKIDLGATVDLALGEQDARVVGQPNSQLGWSVAVADVDGNGARELVTAARQTGVVYALSPPLDGSQLNVALSQFDLAIQGPSSVYFGTSLAHGDLDGDLAADLVIGAPGGDGPGGTRTDCGAAYVVLGSQIGTLTPGEHRSMNLASQGPGLTIYGAARNDKLGSHVLAGKVDVSPDTHDQIIVGAEEAAGGGTARGVVYEIQTLPQ